MTPTEKSMVKKAGMKRLLALLVVGLAAFGWSTFLLGWFAYDTSFITEVCGPPPNGLCLGGGKLPFSSFVPWVVLEIATAVFMGFTLYKVIHNASTEIQKLDDELRQSQAKLKGKVD